MVYKIILTIALAILSGVLGRMGGAGKSGQWYDRILNTNWRDVGCALVLLAVTVLWFGWKPEHWFAYSLAGILTFAAFRTYWDWLFGYDNMWMAGTCVGVAGLPLMWVSDGLWWIWPVRIVLVSLAWGLLNKVLPQKGVLWWRRDVAEENLRYTTSL